jgi:hypothetical protein
MSGKWSYQTSCPTRSTDSIEHDYEPMDDASESGFRRPPRVAGCVLDYFAALGLIEDDGEFAHKEMYLMLDFPQLFFKE